MRFYLRLNVYLLDRLLNVVSWMVIPFTGTRAMKNNNKLFALGANDFYFDFIS